MTSDNHSSKDTPIGATAPRYQRQTLLPQIGNAGQDRLAHSSVLLVGCGALGCTVAELLVRAGMGRLRIADRDVVETTNLQRQILFDEADARDGLPKATAAARRLASINSSIVIEPRNLDVHAGNIDDLISLDGNAGSGPRVDLIIDGSDNVQTRYLLNDVALKFSIPWIYGACVGAEGRVMTVVPGISPCLRCIYPEPPAAAVMPTCDTAGVIGPAAAAVGAMQATAALRYLAVGTAAAALMKIDVWEPRWHVMDLSQSRNPDCPCCARRDFAFLRPGSGPSAVSLCGRDTVQIRPPSDAPAIDLSAMAARLAGVADVQAGPAAMKCRWRDLPGLSMTLFPDGRALIHGTHDLGRARSIYARFVGN